MSSAEAVPCTNDPRLWDSTKPLEHQAAARMCTRWCPIVAACQLEALEEFRTYRATRAAGGIAPLPAEGTRGALLFTHESLRNRGAVSA